MVESDDSRNTAFERKRPHKDSSEEAQSTESRNTVIPQHDSTKRQKPDPVSRDSSTPAVNGNSVSWNQGIKRPTIRTSLGGPRISSLNSTKNSAPEASSQVNPIAISSSSDEEQSISEEALAPVGGNGKEDVFASEDQHIRHEESNESGAYSDATSNYDDPKGVMLNVLSDENSGLESGEIDGQEEDSGEEDDGSDDEDDSSNDEEEDSGDSEGEIHETTPKHNDVSGEGGSVGDDEMMIYADSNVTETSRAIQNKRTAPASNPTSLSQLSTEDLLAQFRYFYVARDPETVPGSDPVHCLVCADEGHMATACPTLTCSTCGVYKEHFTHACPRNAICNKCRTRGHTQDKCHSKLKASTEEIPCNICNRLGHEEAVCEILWRTSGYPWIRDLPTLQIPFYCYECGQSGHLGNDCNTRRPGKGMGSTTWSAAPLSNPLILSGRERSRGKARQILKPSAPSGKAGRGSRGGKASGRGAGSRGGRGGRGHSSYNEAPIEISSDDDDPAAFRRGPPPKASNASMRINVNQAFDRGGNTDRYNYQSREPERPARYDNYRDDGRNGGGFSSRGGYRSFEPSNGGGGGDRYYRGRSRSPPPRGGRAFPRGGGGRYVPMPSAAANAYKRGR